MCLAVNAMDTVSAAIFLYTPALRLASVAAVNMDDAGDTAAAAAMSSLTIVTCLGARSVYLLLTRRIQATSQAWRISH